ncbi:MAG TPA: hypothetical protein VMG12_24660 [Polyangiaceae bacterium]|nr:hypothetical protein [Polyangiaceae bacterium]
MTYRSVGCVWMASALLGAVACSEDEPFPVDPTAPAGRGGSAGNAGRGGMSGMAGSMGGAGAGGADDAGTGDAGSSLPDGGTPRFLATLEGDRVSLSSLDPVWVARCTRNFQVVQREGDDWTPLVDDRPDGTNLLYEAHYLDGVMNDACRLSVGCDVGGCIPLSDVADEIDPFQRDALIAREFVSIGTAAAPTCDRLDAGVDLDGGSDAGVRQIPNIETRVPVGALGVSVRFYTDAQCRTPRLTVVVPVE